MYPEVELKRIGHLAALFTPDHVSDLGMCRPSSCEVWGLIPGRVCLKTKPLCLALSAKDMDWGKPL